MWSHYILTLLLVLGCLFSIFNIYLSIVTLKIPVRPKKQSKMKIVR